MSVISQPASRMPKAIHSARHARLIELLIDARKQAHMTQAQVAGALGRHQPFVANIESGQRRLDVVELLDLTEAIGIDPLNVVRELQKVARGR